MPTLICQKWVEYDENSSRDKGYSLHLNDEARREYIKWMNQMQEGCIHSFVVPEPHPYEVPVTEDIYNLVKEDPKGSISYRTLMAKFPWIHEETSPWPGGSGWRTQNPQRLDRPPS